MEERTYLLVRERDLLYRRYPLTFSMLLVFGSVIIGLVLLDIIIMLIVGESQTVYIIKNNNEIEKDVCIAAYINKLLDRSIIGYGIMRNFSVEISPVFMMIDIRGGDNMPIHWKNNNIIKNDFYNNHDILIDLGYDEILELVRLLGWRGRLLDDDVLMLRRKWYTDIFLRKTYYIKMFAINLNGSEVIFNGNSSISNQDKLMNYECKLRFNIKEI